MRDYILSEKYRYYSKRVSDGTQVKYRKNDWYYKKNKVGNEGLTEYLVYRLLSYTDLSESLILKYEYCRINGVLGCKSKNFLNINEEFVTLNTLFKKLTGMPELSDYLQGLSSPKDRIEYIEGLVSHYNIPVKPFRQYLNILVQLDLLVLNTDRHMHNIGVIYNNITNTFRFAPIFDNGQSLRTDDIFDKGSCTISGSFIEQVTAFGFPVVRCFSIDYVGLYRDLNRIEDMYGRHNEINLLKERLDKYAYLFKR